MFKGKSRLTDNLVALKEIRLEHEEGAPCTAIREGRVDNVFELKFLTYENILAYEKAQFLHYKDQGCISKGPSCSWWECSVPGKNCFDQSPYG